MYADLKAGTEGACRLQLKHDYQDGDCAYPGVEVLPDGAVVTTTYGHWDPEEARCAYIVSVRFHRDEIAAMR